MLAPDRTAGVVLIPARPQTLWGRLAVANFALGGLGAGVHAVATLASLLGVPEPLAVAACLGPALVLAGFAAVAAEAGRPFRGPRVLCRVATSWMSRELWLGGGFVALALLGHVAPRLHILAALVGLGLVAAQGAILREARGVPAWSVGVVPALFLASALASGAGLGLLIHAATAPSLRPAALGGTLVTVAAGTLAWLAYLMWSPDDHFLESTAPLRQGRLALALIAVGHLVPFTLLAVGLLVSPVARAAAALAAVLLVAGQVWAKSALVLRAGRLRPITIPTLRLGAALAIRRSS
jgi:DMSO reductase anchor subunit